MSPKYDEPRLAQGGIARDRADIVATTILAIVADAMRAWWHGDSIDLTDVRHRVASALRDEFADIKRTIAGERIAGLD